MNGRIFILEDNQERIDTFNEILPQKFPDVDLVIAKEASEAMKLLTLNSYWDIILLDHDLGGQVYVDSNDKNTGYQVAKHITRNNVQYSQCIVHSQNPVGAKNIASVLYGCQTIPFPMLVQTMLGG